MRAGYALLVALLLFLGMNAEERSCDIMAWKASIDEELVRCSGVATSVSTQGFNRLDVLAVARAMIPRSLKKVY